MVSDGTKITTNDIARLSNVSRSTVSAVLNGKPGVRQETRQRVLDCIREHSFHSGIVAKSLVGEISRMVAVLVVDVTNPFYSAMLEGIDSVLAQEGYHLLYQRLRYLDPDNYEALRAVFGYRPAGFIVHCGLEGKPAEEFLSLYKPDIPLVTVERIEGVESHAATFDNRKAAKLAADYAMDNGHGRLAYLAGPSGSHGARERKLGVIESVVEHDMDVSDVEIIYADTAELGYNVGLDMLRRPADERPTTVMCFNDFVAIGVYRAAYELGLRIPDDVSIIGFDDIDFAGLLGPPLTTVSIDPHRLGREAAKILLKVLRNEAGRGFMTTEIEPKLVERSSVLRLN